MTTIDYELQSMAANAIAHAANMVQASWQAATDAALAAPAHPERKPMTDEKKEELAGAWFAEDWAKKSAIGMLDDYEKFNGIKP